MAKRLFWFDHRQSEEARDHASSRTNLFEVEMVAALVSHLVRQCQYGPDDIAVLTPYLGQLRKLRSKMGSMFEIFIDDRDETQLRQAGLHEEVEPAARDPATRSTLLRALRLATVDNFQGEEAKVVLISLVRSNEEENCGFLRATNRANALLSRAQHGVYLIGDSSCYEPQHMWGTVLDLLRAEENFGTSLPLRCSRHPETPILVAQADDFARLSPEGGCDLKCADRLSCGHQCPVKCHAPALHERVWCPEPCLKPRAGCEHLCQKRCGDSCGLCYVAIDDVLLQCGHRSSSEPCYIHQDTRLAHCQVLVKREMPGCFHQVEMRCYQEINESSLCKALCGETLRCQHECSKRCYECRKREHNAIVAINHGPCEKPCGVQYTTCGHTCIDRCHRDKRDCRPCSAKCQTRCGHSNCPKPCSQPCDPCAETCRAGCEHSGRCNLPCSVPCDILPCSKRCRTKLECGHQCPSLCGQPCPEKKYCQSCCDESVSDQVVDYTEMLTYGEADLDECPCFILDCGHILAMTSLDGIMDLSEHYRVDEQGSILSLRTSSQPFQAKAGQCPQCRHPIQNVQRYNRIWRRALLDDSTKKFIAWSTAAFVPFSERLDRCEDALSSDNGSNSHQSTRPTTVNELHSIQLSGSFDKIVKALQKIMPLASRHDNLLRLRKNIQSYLRQVTEGEQPFGRVHDMLESIRIQEGRERSHESHSASADTTVLQSKQRIMANSLSLRCDIAILTDFFEIRRMHNTAFTAKYDWRAVDVNVNFTNPYEACLALAGEAEGRTYPMVQVEAILYFARLVALERSNLSAAASINNQAFDMRLTQARELLENATTVCDVYPAQTPGMRDEIDAAEKMLRQETVYEAVTNEEKRQVIQAMKKEFQANGHWYVLHFLKRCFVVCYYGSFLILTFLQVLLSQRSSFHHR